MTADPQPLVSCIMPTRDRRRFVPRAIRCFLYQDYPNKELVIVDDGNDPVADLVPLDDRIEYVRLDAVATTGAKRNRACEEARGSIIAHWDDDDWHAPRRLSYQISALLRREVDVCGIQTLLFYDPEGSTAWRYVYDRGWKFWLGGSSLCYRKSYWSTHPFQHVNTGEDSMFVWSGDPRRMLTLEDSTFHVGVIHPSNASPKAMSGPLWRRIPVDTIRRLVGEEWDLRLPSNAAPINTPSAELAQVRQNTQADLQMRA
jgi:glycosyltransferase involved in cell wall biosynthesis